MLKRYFRELSVAAALGAMLLLLAIFAPNFFQPQPLLSRLTAAAPKLVLACGVALVIIARQIDISIGSLFAVCGTCAGLVAASGLPWPAAMLAAIVMGALGGALNGVLIAGLRLPGHVALALSVGLGACGNALLLLAMLRMRAIYVLQPGWGRFGARVGRRAP